MKNNIVGLDIAKNIFHLVVINEKGKEIRRKSLSRNKVLAYFANIEPSTVALEACGGSNYWGRELAKIGHQIKIIPAEKVKPYLQKQKNDFNDAAAIAEAASRDSVKWISAASVQQQDIQNILRARDRLVKNSNALTNQIRGLLMEYGIVCRKGNFALLKLLPTLLESNHSGRELWKLLFSELHLELTELLTKIKQYDQLMIRIAKNNEDATRLQKLPGVGPITSLAIVASVNNINDFENGRQFSAWLGLVPKQHSSGGKTKLLGITKRGDKYTRKLLVHGGRLLVQHATKDKAEWLYHLKTRRGYNKAAVAQANKTARRIYAVLKHRDQYDFNRQ